MKLAKDIEVHGWQVMVECKDIVKELRSRYNVERVGAEGFCWGGCYTVLLLGSAALLLPFDQALLFVHLTLPP